MSPLLLVLFFFLAPASSFADEVMSPEEVQKLAIQYADLYGVPHGIVLRTVKRESRFIPSARNGPYWGLMQIRYDTAKGVGYTGTAKGLLDPETNLTYGVAYLANAYMIAGGNESMTHRLYRGGYYYAAKRKNLLAKLIKGPPSGATAIMVASAATKPAEVKAAAETPADADVPLPMAKPLVVADAAPDDAEAPASVPLPVPKPILVAEAPGEAPAPIVAKPKVVLASVLPEPHLSLNFGREPGPASAAAMAIAAESSSEAAAALASGEALPLPKPKPGSAAATSPSEPTPDFTASYFDIPVKVLPPMPKPRARPVYSAEAAAPSAIVVATAAPHPKPRPVE